MRPVSFTSLASLAVLASAALLGCTGDDNTVPVPGPDAGSDATVTDGGTDGPTGDGSTPDATSDTGSGNDAGTDAGADAADAGPVGPFLTVSYTFDSFARSGYAAFNVPAGVVQGTLTYAQYGTNLSTNSSPWVLEQANDLVLQMSPTQPWVPVSSWSVTEPPPEDSGASTNSDAFSVAEVGTKAYVALYARDYIAVLDTSHAADGGAPVTSISLSQFVSDADIDHNLEAIAVVSDTAQNLVWVVLGNSNNGAIPPSGAYTPCTAGFHPLVVAIDPTTDTIVAGKAYPLSGYDVYPASAIAFDSVNDRLLVASQGCNEVTDESDGGVVVGALVDSYVESLSLTTGTDTILLNPAPPSPGALVYVDSTHAFLQSANGTNAWNPTQTTLGPLVANAPDAIVWDGQGHLLGPQATSLADGGTSFSIISVDTADGGVVTLATNPFNPSPDPSPYTWEGLDLWPHP